MRIVTGFLAAVSALIATAPASAFWTLATLRTFAPLGTLGAFSALASRTLRLVAAFCAFASLGARTAAEVLPVLFRRELDAHQTFFAMSEAIAHLNHLWQRADVVRSRGADGVYRFVRRA